MASPAEARSFILERLVGDTAEPDRITGAAHKFAQRALATIVQNINRHLSSPLGMELEGIELGRYGNALSGSGETNAVAIIQSVISPDALLLDLEPATVSLLVSAFLGGDPELAPAHIDRPLSQIELEIATTALQEVAEAFNGSGPRSLKLRLPVPTAFSGQEIRKQVLRDGPSVRIVFRLTSPRSTGRLSVTMPQRVLLTPRDETEEPEVEAQVDQSAWSERLREEVRKSSVTLDAVVPLSQMSLGALAALQVGQILEIPAAAQSTTRLSARNKTLFVCEFGKLGQNYSVRIKHPFDESQDFVDRLLSQ
ncbi:flagellar motor switch protein FliM [Mesorhizobium sp. L-8-10]|uniref:FliM/FliN family flagellar motor switch protein n=1 Tax=Mesorhizobium sp. L-8-10 TaxID=2744523 RepID=UPI001927647C|nr:FliM/FliN family flagellar motor switch protein [Mesorhizobium sp. L-8-10]BCH30973.1 flagellar motor switch protein FliM [Mesorhizobium sp. L-8-10]